MMSQQQNTGGPQAATVTHPSHIVTRATPNILKKAKKLFRSRGFRKWLSRLARFKKAFCDERERQKIAELEAARGPFRFRDLPAELRNRVYKLLLVSTEPFVVEFSGSSFGGKNPYRIRIWRHKTGRKNFSIKILCASHQMLDEALPILYGTQKFKLRAFVDARRFLQILAPERRQLLTTLELRWFEFQESPARLRRTLHFLGECVSLKYLTIDYYPDADLARKKLTGADLKGCLANLKNFRLLTVTFGYNIKPAMLQPDHEIKAFFSQMVSPGVQVKLVNELKQKSG